jgi:hypothetical protein
LARTAEDRLKGSSGLGGRGVDSAGSGLCPVVGFDIFDAKPSSYVASLSLTLTSSHFVLKM